MATVVNKGSLTLDSEGHSHPALCIFQNDSSQNYLTLFLFKNRWYWISTL